LYFWQFLAGLMREMPSGGFSPSIQSLPDGFRPRFAFGRRAVAGGLRCAVVDT